MHPRSKVGKMPPIRDSIRILTTQGRHSTEESFNDFSVEWGSFVSFRLNDFKVVTSQDDPDNVLADVVDVSLDGGEDHGAAVAVLDISRPVKI